MRRKLGIRISLGPILEPLKIEVLILECVSKLVGHDWLLTFELDPVGEIKLLCLRIVVARNLFRQELDQKRTVSKILGRQAEDLEHHFSTVHLGRRRVGVEILDDHTLDLTARLGATLHRS